MPERQVLFIAAQAAIRGGEKAMLMLAEAMQQRGWRVSVLVPTAGPPPTGPTLAQALGPLGIPVVEADWPLLRSRQRQEADPWFWARMIRDLRHATTAILAQIGREWDLIISNDTWSFIGMTLAESLNARHVWYVHDHAWDGVVFSEAPPPPVARLMGRTTDLFLCPAEPLAREMRRFVPSDRAVVVSAGVDDLLEGAEKATLDSALQDWLAQPDPVITAVGSTSPVKAWELLVQAVAIVRKDGPRARLCLVGPDDSPESGRSLESLIDGLGLTQSVRRTGYCAAPAAVLRRSVAHVISSVSEVLPFALLEAMSVGCPTVTVPCRGPETVVRDGVTGRVAGERTPEALAEAIVSLLADPARGRQFGQAAREECLRDYTVSAWRERCLTAIEGVAGRPARDHRVSRLLKWPAWIWAEAACRSPKPLVGWENALARHLLPLAACSA